MKTYTDRLTKLGNELDNVVAKITEYENRREAIVREIQGIVSGGATAKTGGSGIPRPSGAPRLGRPRTSLGEKILPILNEQPGSTTEQIASRLRTTVSRVGVSLYHMTQRNQVRREGSNWFPNATTESTQATA